MAIHYILKSIPNTAESWNIATHILDSALFLFNLNIRLAICQYLSVSHFLPQIRELVLKNNLWPLESECYLPGTVGISNVNFANIIICLLTTNSTYIRSLQYNDNILYRISIVYKHYNARFFHSLDVSQLAVTVLWKEHIINWSS